MPKGEDAELCGVFPFMFISYDCKLIQKHKFQNILNVKWNIFAFSLTHYCKSIIIVT